MTPPDHLTDDEELREIEELERRAYGKRPMGPFKFMGLFVVVALVGLFALGAVANLLPKGEPSPSTADLLAGQSCLKAAGAIEEYERGTRSLMSTLDVLQGQEDDMRDAASLDPKYAPLARAVVEAQNELAAGEPGILGVGVILANCGSQRGS